MNRGHVLKREKLGGDGRFDGVAGVAGVAMLALGVLAWARQMVLFWPHVNDDAYITFRYSWFLAQGLGPFFNVGEPVEGYTNFLLMLLLALVAKVGGAQALPITAKLIGVVSATGCLAMVAESTRRMMARERTMAALALPTGLAAAAVLATSPGFAVNSTSGLETSLYSMLLLLGAALAVRSALANRWLGSGIAFALAALTRPEGAAVFAVCWLATAAFLVIPSYNKFRQSKLLTWRDAEFPRFLVIDGLVITGAVLGHLAFRYLVYDGEFLPNTYYAKIGGFTGEDPVRYVYDGAWAPLLGIPGVLMGVVGVMLRRGLRTVLAPFLAAGLFGAHLPLVTAADWMIGQRLVVPFLPLLVVPITVGWASLLLRGMEAIGLSWERCVALAPAALAILVVGLWANTSPARGGMHAYVALRARGYDTGHGTIARWLQENARPGETVALMDIGIIGFQNPGLRVLDTSGLTDRTIAKSEGGFLDKQYDVGYVLGQKPTYIVLTYSADGVPYSEPAGAFNFRAGTTIDGAIWGNADFRRWYVREPADVNPGAEGNWLRNFGRQLGCVQIVEHGHPGVRYFLALFVRRETPRAE